MNPLVIKLCNIIKEEIEVIHEVRKLSSAFCDIVANRNLDALQENNRLKKAALMKMLHIQKTKDLFISELAASVGLHVDSPVKEILDSNTLDKGSFTLLSDNFSLLLEEVKILDNINCFVSIVLSSSYRLFKNAINLFNIHGSIDSVYSNKVNRVAVDSTGKYSNVSSKV